MANLYLCYNFALYYFVIRINVFSTNTISRLFGLFAHTRFPKSMQYAINRFYVDYFKINLSEFDSLESYPTLNALFTRSLTGNRQLQANPFNLISPTDSLITESGRITKHSALQIKGRSYNVNDLLGCEDDFNSYSFLNLYLSPRDYHHYHAPCNLEILQARYFSGKLLPVNQASLYKNDNLFIQNERVVLKMRCFYNQSIIYYVAVGALNVGKMQFLFDSSIQTNAKYGNRIYNYKEPIKLNAGDEIGFFEMGSTIVLIAKANWCVKSGCHVKMGDEIGTLEI